MKKSRFLITGCCGFIGSHWAEKLLKNGHEVTGIDIKPKNKIFNEYKNFKYYKMSINNETLIKKLVKKSDIICHFAAIANPAEYLSDPYKVIQLDALAAIKIIDIVAKYKKKFIFTSTSEVYGKSSKVPFAEDDDRMLGSTNINRWCYSTSKSLVEHYLFALKKQKRIEFLSYRLFNVYGPRLTERVVPIFIEKFKKNNDVTILGSGNNTRTYLYIDDCIEAFYLSYKNFSKMKNEVYNIGTNFEISSKKLAIKIKKLCNSKSKIIYMNSNLLKKQGYEDIPRRVPSTKKIKSKIDWKPKINLEKGLKLTIENF